VTTLAAGRERIEGLTGPEEIRRSAFLLLSSVLALIALGVVMVYSAAAVESAEAGAGGGSPLRPLLSHAAKAGAALALMLGAASLHPRTLARLALPFYVLSIVLLALVLVPGVGVAVNGSRRWFALPLAGGFALQPSELAKLALVLLVAAHVARRPDLGAGFGASFLPAAAIVLLPGALILLETDFGTFVLVSALGFLLLLVAGARVRHLALLGLLTLPVAAAFVAASPRTSYVLDRVGAFLGRPGEAIAPAQGALEQIDFAESALRVGGLSGVGLGAGRHKLFFLPESENDFILAIVGEELGFIGTSIVLLLFALLLWSGRRVLLGVRHRFGFIVVTGVLITIAMQMLMNVFVAVRWAPVKGIPLPFVSSGGSSLAALSLGVGLVLAIARHPELDDPELGPEPGDEAT